MASHPFAPDLFARRRIPLAEIDTAVSARLGPTRGLGNSQPACFNRQVAMYLARYVGGWSTKIIGRFYNGRDHTTVTHGIQRIEALRDSDHEVDALLSDLKYQLRGAAPVHDTREAECDCGPLTDAAIEKLADLVAERVCAYLERRLQHLPGGEG